ncbi:hypothetical protein [Pseudomonas xantholysinigenes]|uniref:Uncharacterized protein n=1 Tax=Pseudomonas xantholysinigenes TaxID=2745490 RepID=A0A9E6PZR8_9PSED|nr:hypothetical protein [Pseudomonas xantholysinigenes]QXI39903.1 hypothetical protein HU772_007410 [Pseudomonas xantholysinigenes]
MKYIVLSVTMLLSTALAAASGTQLPHENTVGGQRVEGNVIIYDKELRRSCSLQPIAGVNEVYRFGSGKTCTSLPSDEAYYFKIDGVPSAVLVTFYDSPDCSSDVGNFAFMVRTTQSPTTLNEILLSDAHEKPAGTILGPGLRLEWKTGSGQVGGKLSCVRIEH